MENEKNQELAIKIDNLDYFYEGEVQALKEINLEINKNEFIGIIGQNGAGKSTLLKNIIGLLKPSEGSVVVMGNDTCDSYVCDISTKVGFVLQNPDLQLFAQTVKEEVDFGPKNLGYEGEELENTVNRALKQVGMEDRKEDFPPALSRGERAKVVIASVLAMEPSIIIFDEPTRGQDYEGERQIMDIAAGLHNKGKTVIVVTHDMQLIAEYANRLIVLKKGELFMDGPLRNVFSEPEKLLETHIKPPPIVQIAQQLEQEVENFELEGKTLSVEELGEQILSKIKK